MGLRGQQMESRVAKVREREKEGEEGEKKSGG